ncbi:MAG: DNA polymerase IV [Desulfarculales bacterium]|jgi:DNA polymerase-4|nr:DNA polymerase IV [Desulfarculales bacterium]
MLAHVDLDAFYASVEELDQPEIKGRAVIVGGLEGRGVVSSCSYAARRFGVHSAMPISQARRLCPRGVFLPVRMSRYQEASCQVMDILSRFSPVLEQISVDEAFMDLRGVTHLWGGSPAQTGLKIKETVRKEAGLNCSVGIAPLRFLAKIASERSKPDGLLLVDDVEGFLPTVELKEVSGVGAKTLRLLGDLGAHKLFDLRSFPPPLLERRLGKHGPELLRLAWGRDERGLEPQRQVKSVSHETTFAQDLARKDIILSHLMVLCQKVGTRLRQAGMCAGTFTLKIKYPDFKQKTLSSSSGQPTDQTLDIFNRLHGFVEEGTAIRLLGVGAGNLRPARQDGLFNRGRQQALHQAEDYLQRRFGLRGLTRARTLLLDKERMDE